MQELQQEKDQETNTNSNKLNIEQTIEKLKSIENDVKEYNDTLEVLDKNTDLYKRLESKIKTLQVKKESLTGLLNNNESINNYININYKRNVVADDTPPLLFNQTIPKDII